MLGVSNALLTVAVCVLLGISCDAFSKGAPQGACETQEPLGHTGARRNPAPNPYSLSAPMQAKPSETLTGKCCVLRDPYRQVLCPPRPLQASVESSETITGKC
ncbi:hypothetical protein FHG87_002914 [Trinorchestia longiramus]|nr:hypothetical protein FHG87_002914 [Trinorchestia longiramus]